MSDAVKELDLYSEPYAATGNLGDTGMRKLLGSPTLDLLQTVIRESVQNCCDAAKLGSGPEVQFRLRTLTSDQMEFLTKTVLKRLPAGGANAVDSKLPLMQDEPIMVLEIVDLGTTGLAGPVRADRLPPGVRYTDFIDFFRNVGTARNTDSGGGTYGFGKSSLYMTSGCSTILVDSMTEVTGQPVRRFMGCHIGGSFTREGEDGNFLPFTGRHWWGRCTAEDPVVDPLENEEARTIATSLGMPERNSERRGTTIMILAPALGGQKPEEVGERIVEEMLWHFWPRLTADTPPESRLRARVEVEGKVLDFPPPEQWPPLDLYCQALAQIRRCNDPKRDDDVQSISSKRPQMLLGRCAVVKGFRAKNRYRRADADAAVKAHSIALMRPVGFVVRYLEGPSLPEETLQWAGVFVVDDNPEVEKAFARSEPPAHDDWQYALLSKEQGSTYVRVALRRLREIANGMADISPMQGRVTGTSSSAVKVANRLGELLGSSVASDESEMSSSSSGSSSRRRRKSQSRTVKAKVSPARFERIGMEDGQAFAEFAVDVVCGLFDWEFEFAPQPVVDGAFLRTSGNVLESDVALPEIISIADSEGNPVLVNGYSVRLSAGFDGTLIIRSTLPKAMAIGLSVKKNQVSEVG